MGSTTTSTTTSTTSTTTATPSPISLEDTLSEIHSTETPQDLSDNFNNFKTQIEAQLSSNVPSRVLYYRNHTGRELFRKLYNFGLSDLIPTTYDSGFRPDDTSLGS